MRGSWLLVALLAVASPARAQRERWEAPAILEVVPWAGPSDAPRPYRYVVSIRAESEVEVITDARLVRFEVTVPGRRRPHRCDMPGRPRRADTSLARRLARGERWSEWIDLREYCWGRALEALGTEGATVRATYEVGRGRAAWVARSADGSESDRSLVPADVVRPAVGVSAGGEPAAARVTLASADTRSGAPRFRVAVYGGGETRRVWISPDRFSFRVVDPTGATWVCAMPRTGARAIPDLFSRISSRRAARLTLDGGAYCDGEIFETPGVYDVTPIVTLDEDGATWELDAVTGTFEGAPAAVRVRGARGDRSVPADVERALFR